ncbi:hydrogenase maturation nickel metallochaperone HypA [Magnetospira sp. QH-2]|uniref:hydrogenase maturation nickel metallochaperone HypA n=1 Tax=Magnetospira sp. (strain QH-2) TaxID=1288970 RepID=UPI0003E81BEB|nr:hydrogenase maturation nickel metallochaperone HypA [Magnetospira sp. QH-2]CCQ72955.1 Hydrogenase nickel incorporation protein HypA [Magnetospira sp. QH-2]
MHEMSLTESMVRIIEDQARAQNFFKVKTVWLELGQLSHAEPEAMLFCFDAVTKGTIAEGAVLELIRTPGTAWCLDCGESVEIARRYDPCPKCDGHKLQVTDGEDMRIRELEVE